MTFIASSPPLNQVSDLSPRGYTDCMMLRMQDPQIDFNNKGLDIRMPLTPGVQYSDQEVMDVSIDTISFCVVLRFDFRTAKDS